MRAKFLITALVSLLLTACGPIIGSVMVSSAGVKDFKVVSGRLSDLKAGSKVLVLAPFAKTPESFYICRGEDASVFTTSLNDAGLFVADFHMEDRFEDNGALFTRLKKSSAGEIQSQLNLKEKPQYLLTGTILSRETVAAPKQGVIMKVAYRLEFTSLNNGKSTVIEIEVHELFQQAIPAVVKELTKRIAG